MWPVGGGDRGRKKPRFRGCGGRGGRTTPSSPAPALILSRGSLSLSAGAHSLSTVSMAPLPRGLSFPSNSDSSGFPFVGAGVMRCGGSRVPTTSAAVLGALFLAD